jgi:hypothetical protein
MNTKWKNARMGAAFALVGLFVALPGTSQTAHAQKAQFQRSKPHVNVSGQWTGGKISNGIVINRVRASDKPLRLAPSKRVGDTKFLDGRGIVAPRLPLMTTSRFEGERRTVKPMGKAKLLGNGRPVKDTCDSSQGDDETCNPDKLAARCDAAGGGMSSLPGGGVDCDTSHWD